jgi:hypothetical protein
MNLLDLNRGTVNPRFCKGESGQVLKPKIRRLKGGITPPCDGFARTSFVTSRLDTTGIQSVLRHMNGSNPVDCCFPVFDLQSLTLGWRGSMFRINIGPTCLTNSRDS